MIEKEVRQLHRANICGKNNNKTTISDKLIHRFWCVLFNKIDYIIIIQLCLVIVWTWFSFFGSFVYQLMTLKYFLKSCSDVKLHRSTKPSSWSNQSKSIALSIWICSSALISWNITWIYSIWMWTRTSFFIVFSSSLHPMLNEFSPKSIRESGRFFNPQVPPSRRWNWVEKIKEFRLWYYIWYDVFGCLCENTEEIWTNSFWYIWNGNVCWLSAAEQKYLLRMHTNWRSILHRLNFQSGALLVCLSFFIQFLYLSISLRVSAKQCFTISCHLLIMDTHKFLKIISIELILILKTKWFFDWLVENK